MTATKRWILALCLLLLPNLAFLQVNDAGVWGSFGLKKDLNKDWKASLEIETRFAENWSELATAFGDLSVRYDVNKHFKAALNYRFGNRREDDNTFSLRQRWALDLTAETDIDKVEISYRSRFQVSQRNLGSREQDVEFSNGWRNKFSADFKLMKKTDFGASVELFASEDELGWYLSDFRVTAGLSYKLKKRKYLKLGYLFQSELQTAKPERDYVLLLGYSLELK